jgi:hypothetical protein
MDPIIFSALGGLLANALSGIVGNQADRAVVAAWRIIVERLRKGGRSVNHELQRAVLRSFILALRSICDDCLKELKAEKNASAEDILWLKEKRRSLEKELKEVEKLEYSELPLEIFDEIQLLLRPDGTLAQERLQALKSALVRAAIGESEPPRCYKDKCNQSLFELMSAYFAEEIKHNQVVRNIFEGKLLAQIDVRLQEQELKLDTIIEYLRSITPSPPPTVSLKRARAIAFQLSWLMTLLRALVWQIKQAPHPAAVEAQIESYSAELAAIEGQIESYSAELELQLPPNWREDVVASWEAFINLLARIGGQLIARKPQLVPYFEAGFCLPAYAGRGDLAALKAIIAKLDLPEELREPDMDNILSWCNRVHNYILIGLHE